MKPAVRAALAAAALVVLAAALAAGMRRLPPFGEYRGPYGTVLNAVAPRERHIPNVVTAVNFDYRGLDTLGEEFILFAAVSGLLLVLREDRKAVTSDALPSARPDDAEHTTEAATLFALPAIAVTIAFGLYMAAHPHLTPGGGFQGGAITAGFAAVIFIALGYGPFRRLCRHDVGEALEAIGAGAYAVVGVAALAVAGAFLANVLPLGTTGAFFSTGTIELINACVAVEVITGFVLMFAEFADETRVERADPEHA